MKLLTSFLSLFLLVGCSTQKFTNLSYSSEFKLSFPTNFFSDVTIFYSDGISLKIDSGKLLSAQIISNELESFSDDFDIREYPNYLLKIKPLDNLSSHIADKFRNSSIILDDFYGLNNVKIETQKIFTLYSLCSHEECLAYIVKNTFKDHIFLVSSIGMDKEHFMQIIRNNLHVKP